MERVLVLALALALALALVLVLVLVSELACTTKEKSDRTHLRLADSPACNGQHATAQTEDLLQCRSC